MDLFARLKSAACVLLKDLGSTNGTRVNSKEIKKADLHPKDLVQVGSIEFLFDAEGAEAAAEAPAFSHAKVEVTSGPATAPISFGSISPFGARRKENTALWYTLIIGIGALAIAGIAWFVITILRAG